MIVLSDNDSRGASKALRAIIQSSWADISTELDIVFKELEDVGLSADSSDSAIWFACQHAGIVLITSDRNGNDGNESLEYIIRKHGTQTSLPVFTLADAARIVRNRDYANGCADRLIDGLCNLEGLRGTQRFYLSPDLQDRHAI